MITRSVAIPRTSIGTGIFIGQACGPMPLQSHSPSQFRAAACQGALRHTATHRQRSRIIIRIASPSRSFSEGWNPVQESHQHVRFCKPPPGLLGQRDNRVKLRRPTKGQNLRRADLGSPADSSIRGLNRSRSPRCNACARESRAERGSLRPTHPDRKQTPA